MRSLVVATIAGIVALSTSPASADAPIAKLPSAAKNAKDKKKKPAVAVASAAIVAPPPASIAQPAVESSTSSSDRTPDAARSAGTGVVVSLASGATFLSGGIARSADVNGAFATLDVRVAAYLTPRFAIVAGVELGHGVLFDGCSEICEGYHYQFPVVAQYAFGDRRRGAFLDGGFAVLSTYGATKGSETLEASVPVDLKLGVGYRLPLEGQKDMVAPSLVRSLEVRFGADLGTFKTISYDGPSLKAEADIPSERQTLHYAIGLAAGVAFAP